MVSRYWPVTGTATWVNRRVPPFDPPSPKTPAPPDAPCIDATRAPSSSSFAGDSASKEIGWNGRGAGRGVGLRGGAGLGTRTEGVLGLALGSGDGGDSGIGLPSTGTDRTDVG